MDASVLEVQTEATGWSRIVEHLYAVHDGGGARHVVDGALCVRVGRNSVWRVSRGNAVVFVKYCRSEGEIRRRQLGADIGKRLAAKRSRFGAPGILAVAERQRAIVVSECRGVPVDQLFRQAYRIDKNPFRRVESIRRFRAALAGVKRYLEALHDAAPVDNVHLVDHRPATVLQRIESHLARLGKRIDAFKKVRLPPMPSSVADSPACVLSDTTLGNFLFDGENVFCVDFEDVGRGDPRRDFMILAESMQIAMVQWHYVHDDFGELLPTMDRADSWDMLYALEPQLWRVWTALRRSSRGLKAATDEACRRIALLHTLVMSSQ